MNHHPHIDPEFLASPRHRGAPKDGPKPHWKSEGLSADPSSYPLSERTFIGTLAGSSSEIRCVFVDLDGDGGVKTLV